MLCLLKRRNPLQWILLPQITQTLNLPLFLNPSLIINGASPNSLSPILSFFSSLSQHESPKTKTKADPILNFFRSYEFTDAQIKRLIHRCPSVQTMKPKLEHLLSFGFSPRQLTLLISCHPNLLATSLTERIEPNLRHLEQTLGSKSCVIKSLTVIHGWSLLGCNLDKAVIPNTEILRENSLSMNNIVLLFTKFPLVLLKHPDVLTETVRKLKDLGMEPSKLSFIHAMNIMIALKKKTWERKIGLFMSFGWSQKETLCAFARQPSCFGLSDETVRKRMDFFKEKLHWDSAMLLRLPIVIMFSLEGRILPRCAVMSVLAKNGLWNGKPSLCTLLMATSQKDFERKFVDKYGTEVHQVIDAYQGKVEFLGFDRKY